MKKNAILILTSLSMDPAMVTMTTTVLDVNGGAIPGASVKLHKNTAGLPEAYVLAESQGNGIYSTSFDSAISYIYICWKKGYKPCVKYIPSAANSQQSTFTVTLAAE